MTSLLMPNACLRRLLIHETLDNGEFLVDVRAWYHNSWPGHGVHAMDQIPADLDLLAARFMRGDVEMTIDLPNLSLALEGRWIDSDAEEAGVILNYTGKRIASAPDTMPLGVSLS